MTNQKAPHEEAAVRAKAEWEKLTDDDVHQVFCEGNQPCVGIHVYGADIGQVQRWVPEIYGWYSEHRRGKALLAP